MKNSNLKQGLLICIKDSQEMHQIGRFMIVNKDRILKHFMFKFEYITMAAARSNKYGITVFPALFCDDKWICGCGKIEAFIMDAINPQIQDDNDGFDIMEYNKITQCSRTKGGYSFRPDEEQEHTDDPKSMNSVFQKRAIEMEKRRKASQGIYADGSDLEAQFDNKNKVEVKGQQQQLDDDPDYMYEAFMEKNKFA